MSQRKPQRRVEPTLGPVAGASATEVGKADARAEVEAVIHATAEAWNSQDFASVLELWDPSEATPFYLAEEQEDWFIGWDPLRNYLAPPTPSPAVQGIREEMRNIHVKFIAPDLALAAWWMHFEMKIIFDVPDEAHGARCRPVQIPGLPRALDAALARKAPALTRALRGNGLERLRISPAMVGGKLLWFYK